MDKILAICIYNFIFLFPAIQPEINYEHKRIYKELEKTWGMENPVLKELLLPDSIGRLKQIQGKYFSVSGYKHPGHPHYIYIGRVNSCRAGGCSISPDTEIFEDTEYFDYFMLFDSIVTVQQVRVFNYQATHGHEVSAKGWLKQFEGYNGTDSLEVGKNVDAISGATISVYTITLDVQEKTDLLYQFVN